MAMASPILRRCFQNLHSHSRKFHCFRALSKHNGFDKGSENIVPARDKKKTVPALGDKDVYKSLDVVSGSADEPVPRESDIVVIGGGAIGMSVAYWLKQRHSEGYTITVIEKDPCYTKASTVLSCGGIRQQFSLPENIKMSLFGAEFLRDVKQTLRVLDLDPPDIQFNPQGYLILADEERAEILRENHRTQKSLGAKVDLMDQTALKQKFPALNFEDVAIASHGLANEGWFDPWSLLVALKTKSAELGTRFVTGEVTGFETKKTTGSIGGVIQTRDRLQTVLVKAEDGITYPIRMAMCINCAGSEASRIGEMAGIGTGADSLSVPIPVEPRKRFVYVVHCPDAPGLDMPFLIDFDGTYIRRDGLGGNYLVGCSQAEEEEPDISSLETIDYDWFDDKVWPSIAHRAPCFEKLKDSTTDSLEVDPNFFKECLLPNLVQRLPALASAQVKNAWAGYYDYNYVDQNLIIGNHPYHRNFFMAVGSSGHGLQHAPAIGRAMMELIIDDEYQTIDLSRFCFDRFLTNEHIYETGII